MTAVRRRQEADDEDVVDRHPATTLNEVVHQRTRLGILTVLFEAERADFSYLKSVLDLTDGNLGRHLEVLEEKGLVIITKGFEGKRPRTWATISRDGRQALLAEVGAMKDIVERLEQFNRDTK